MLLVHIFNLLFQRLELRLVHPGYPFDPCPLHPFSQEVLNDRRFSQPETHSQWTGSGILEDHWEIAQPRNR